MKTIIFISALIFSSVTMANTSIAEKQLKETRRALQSQLVGLDQMKNSIYTQIDNIDYTISSMRTVKPFKVIHQLEYMYYVGHQGTEFTVKGKVSGPDAYEGQLVELLYNGEVIAETFAAVNRRMIDHNEKIEYSFRPIIKNGTYLGTGFSVKISDSFNNSKTYKVGCTASSVKRCGKSN